MEDDGLSKQELLGQLLVHALVCSSSTGRLEEHVRAEHAHCHSASHAA